MNQVSFSCQKPEASTQAAQLESPAGKRMKVVEDTSSQFLPAVEALPSLSGAV